jgi:hypothetical protein
MWLACAGRKRRRTSPTASTTRRRCCRPLTRTSACSGSCTLPCGGRASNGGRCVRESADGHCLSLRRAGGQGRQVDGGRGESAREDAPGEPPRLCGVGEGDKRPPRRPQRRRLPSRQKRAGKRVVFVREMCPAGACVCVRKERCMRGRGCARVHRVCAHGNVCACAWSCVYVLVCVYSGRGMRDAMAAPPTADAVCAACVAQRPLQVVHIGDQLEAVNAKRQRALDARWVLVRAPRVRRVVFLAVVGCLGLGLWCGFTMCRSRSTSTSAVRPWSRSRSRARARARSRSRATSRSRSGSGSDSWPWLELGMGLGLARSDLELELGLCLNPKQPLWFVYWSSAVPVSACRALTGAPA